MSLETVKDIRLDENFEVGINSRGDIGTVSGREAFEQRVRLLVTDRVTQAIGVRDADPNHVSELVQSYLQEIAADMDMLDRIVSYSASFADTESGKLTVEVVYDTSDSFSFEVDA